MKKTHIRTTSLLALALAVAGCSATTNGSGNRDYTDTSFQGAGNNNAMIFSGQYASPHSF
ncbi:hypothetical protein NKJ28_00335 [Mesorhizobium sp. M0145]|uniref:hypothetical protein n=1 Tax=Mesorhizobium sp. M0145 TaxID=2956895 RepID=UPI003336F718